MAHHPSCRLSVRVRLPCVFEGGDVRTGAGMDMGTGSGANSNVRTHSGAGKRQRVGCDYIWVEP